MDNYPEQKENLIATELPDPVATPPPYPNHMINQGSHGFQHTNTVVVTNQPRPYINRHTDIHPSDNYFTLSIVLSFVWCIFGTCGLCCIIPAIVYAVHAREAEMRGDIQTMRVKRQTSLGLNIVGSLFGFVTTAAYIGYMVYSYHRVQVEVEHSTTATPTPYY